MEIITCELPGLLIINKSVHEDERGYFMEIYNRRDWDGQELIFDFVQDNLSVSKKGVLRGLHYQKKHPQGKLVSVLAGEIYDVAVDIRKNSETFGQWQSFVLSSDNHKQLFLPAGFAHGFLCLSGQAIVNYKTTEFYYPRDEGHIAWNDSQLNISWPVKRAVNSMLYEMSDGTPLVLSIKDNNSDSFESFANSITK